MREKLVIGNWKMHGSRDFVTSLLAELTTALSEPGGVTVAVCPTALHLSIAAECLNSSEIFLGAQTLSSESSGAFTGEWSAEMLTDLNVRYVLVGHSERRTLFQESDEQVAAKLVAAQKKGLIPVLCVGEMLEERELGITNRVVQQQLDAVLDQYGIDALANAIIAYEPVWAIGTGKTATPEQAQQVHGMIRSHLNRHDEEIAARTPILYGGSVNSANAEALFAEVDIDGGLVGGASLKASDFSAICQSFQ